MEGTESGEITDVDVEASTKGFMDRAGEVMDKVLSSPERATELLAAQIMMGIEISHDMSLYPTKYGLRPDQVSQQLTEPMARWAMDHIGDIWEISVGHTALRIGFVALNEVLKTDRVKKLQKKVLKNDRAKKLASKFIESERVEELSKGEEIHISDEACFWASLTTIVTIKAIHSMGWITLFHIHDHMDNPVPGMLFGQAVAAVVLATTHYAVKHRESIKDLALRAGKGTIEGGKSLGKKIEVSVDSGMASVDATLKDLGGRLDTLNTKLQGWDPYASIPGPEAVVQALLNKRKAKAELVIKDHDDQDAVELK